jgi:hypothetical protein
LFIVPHEEPKPTKIKNIEFTVDADFYYTPGTYTDARCRTTFKLIICTFNLPINKQKTKFRMTEVVYSKRNSGYGTGNGYSRKMYSQVDKADLYDPNTISVAGYWEDCFHTINETLPEPVPSSGSQS